VGDLTVQVICEGDFAAVHLHGDNAAVVPTDTMKNTVYALAQDRLGHQLERFARVLAAHFLEFPTISGVRVEIEERLWTRLAGHGHAFQPAGGDRRLARVRAGTFGDRIEAGVRGLLVLKTAGSSFTGFTQDRYTTLPETTNRLMASNVNAEWRYHRHPDDFTATWRSVRAQLVETFAGPASQSVQEQAWMMGQAVLAAHPEVAEITVAMPNKHHLSVDLTRFGLEDKGVIFQPVDEPYGDITVTAARSS
jgi:urate oxidase